MSIAQIIELIAGALLLAGLPIRILWIGMLIGYRWAKESVAANGSFSDHLASLLEAALQRHHRNAWRREAFFAVVSGAIGAALVYWAFQ